MNLLTITYAYNYELDFANNYKFTKCGLCVNIKTGRVIKKVYNSGSKGYNICGKFYTLNRLRPHLQKCKKVAIPF